MRINPVILKLSALFAKYLYLKKELNLPGIGVFTLDPSVMIPEATDKNATDFVQQIKYVQKPVASADDDFINFIRTETGKIRPLAESDLDSFLTDGKILLNIGKPFHLDGIGSIIKTRTGVYEFTPGEPIHSKENFYNELKEEPTRKKGPYSSEDSVKTVPMRSVFIVGGIIAGLIFIIWGGYTLYNKKSTAPVSAGITDTIASTPTKANTILDSVKKLIDSSAAKVAQSSAGGTYKFIIERTANKLRADKRYSQIKATQTDIKMESRDSTLFSLYFVLPASASDTTRIKDSLKNWYGRKNVFIER